MLRVDTGDVSAKHTVGEAKPDCEPLNQMAPTRSSITILKKKKKTLHLANYSRVSISGESGILQDHGEMLYFGQQRPGRTVVTLIWDLER